VARPVQAQVEEGPQGARSWFFHRKKIVDDVDHDLARRVRFHVIDGCRDGVEVSSVRSCRSLRGTFMAPSLPPPAGAGPAEAPTTSAETAASGEPRRECQGSTYSPGSVNVTRVSGFVGSAKVTATGPLTCPQIGSGTWGAKAKASRRATPSQPLPPGLPSKHSLALGPDGGFTLSFSSFFLSRHNGSFRTTVAIR